MRIVCMNRSHLYIYSEVLYMYMQATLRGQPFLQHIAQQASQHARGCSKVMLTFGGIVYTLYARARGADRDAHVVSAL